MINRELNSDLEELQDAEIKGNIKGFKTTYFAFNFVITMFSGFLIPYLKHLNITNSYIGIIMAIMTVSGILGQVFTGYLCDLKNTIKSIFIIWEGILGILVFVFSVINNNLNLLIFLLFCLGFIQSALCSLIDSWIMENEEAKSRFGPIRAYGSIGAGIASIIFGYLTDRMGWNIIFITYPIFMLALILITTRAKDINKVDSKPSNEEKIKNNISLNDVITLLSNKRYIYLVTIFLILFMSLKVITMFSVLNIKNISDENWYLGTFTFITAVSEIPIFLFSPKIMKKINAYRLLIIASIFFIIRILLVAFSSNVYTIVFSGIFHMTTFSFIALSSKYLIDEISPARLRTTSQMLSMAIYLSFGDGMASLISGIMSDTIGNFNTLLIFCFMCGVSFIMSIVYMKKCSSFN